jgi:hypothetical protein
MLTHHQVVGGTPITLIAGFTVDVDGSGVQNGVDEDQLVHSSHPLGDFEVAIGRPPGTVHQPVPVAEPHVAVPVH